MIHCSACKMKNEEREMKNDRALRLHSSFFIFRSSFFIDSAVLVVSQKLAEARVVANGVEVVIVTNVLEIAIAQLDRPAQGPDGLVRPAQQGVAACQVIMSQRIVGTELHESPIDLQAV